MKKAFCRIFGCSYVKYGRVKGFENEVEFPLVSDDECFILGEVPDNFRKWCSFEIRCQRCGGSVAGGRG